MGCEWYSIKQISAVGFFIQCLQKEYDELIEILTSDDNYGCIIFGDTEDGEEVIIQLFIFDKKTLFRTKLSLPGPYEINLCNHQTLLQEYNTKGYLDKIETMSLNFDKKCSYWNLLTTMGVGHFLKPEKSIDINFFKTIQEYKEHFGYQ
jgi:hypothetical protein